MPSRAELNLRAHAMGFDASTIANDSKLEQKVLHLEKNQTKVAISGTAPTTTLTSTGTFANNDTITFTFPNGDARTYTMKTTLTGAANEVLIGASASVSLDNIKAAINGTGTAGTDYTLLTRKSGHLTAGAKTATTLVIASSDTNTNGSIGTTKSAANFAFTGATMSAGTLGAVVVTNAGVGDSYGQVSGDKNVS